MKKSEKSGFLTGVDGGGGGGQGREGAQNWVNGVSLIMTQSWSWGSQRADKKN